MSKYTKYQRPHQRQGDKGVLIVAGLFAFVLVSVSVWAVDDYRHDQQKRERDQEHSVITHRQRAIGKKLDDHKEKLRDIEVEYRNDYEGRMKAVAKLEPLMRDIERDMRDVEALKRGYEAKWGK